MKNNKIIFLVLIFLNVEIAFKMSQNEVGGSNSVMANAVQGTPGTRVSTLNPPPNVSGGSSAGVLDKRRLHELVKEVDPLEQMDEDVEEV